jgi:hypothetical protein
VNVTARQTREVYDLAGTPEADAAQAQLSEARAFLDGYPLIPALKALMDWPHMRPPLEPLDKATASELRSASRPGLRATR